MRNFLIAIIAVLSLTSCEKFTGSHARNTFVKMCEEDPNAKAQAFDCGCQADVLNAVLKNDEMTRLIDFINIEKQDKNKAMELGKDPSYEPIFRKIAGVGYAIHDKCGKPGAESAAPAQSSAAPASEPAPAEQAKPSTPSNFKPATVVGRSKK